MNTVIGCNIRAHGTLAWNTGCIAAFNDSLYFFFHHEPHFLQLQCYTGNCLYFSQNLKLLALRIILLLKTYNNKNIFTHFPDTNCRHVTRFLLLFIHPQPLHPFFTHSTFIFQKPPFFTLHQFHCPPPPKHTEFKERTTSFVFPKIPTASTKCKPRRA